MGRRREKPADVTDQTRREACWIGSAGESDVDRARAGCSESFPAGPVAGRGNTQWVDRDSARKVTPGAGPDRTGRGSSLSRRRGRGESNGATRAERHGHARPADGHPGDRMAGRWSARRTHEGIWTPERSRERPKRRFHSRTVARLRPCPPPARSQPGVPRTESPPPAPGHTATLGSTRSGIKAGRRGLEPHGREWPKYATGPGEEQTAKVVGNGGGGPKRGWNPATRHGGTVTV